MADFGASFFAGAGAGSSAAAAGTTAATTTAATTAASTSLASTLGTAFWNTVSPALNTLNSALTGQLSAGGYAKLAMRGLSLASTNSAGLAQRAASKFQASISQQQGEVIKLQAAQDSNEIRQRLIATLAANNAAAGVAGLSVASGSIQNAQMVAAKQANRELSINRTNANIAARMKQIEAQQIRAGARSSMLSTYGDLATKGYGYFTESARTGEP